MFRRIAALGAGTLVVLVLCFLLSVGSTIMGLWWMNTFGPWQNRVQYNIFNSSPQHVQAIAAQFSRDCEQESLTTDPVAKKAIEEDIYQASVTVNMKDMVLAPGVLACVNKAIHDVGGNQ